MSKTFEHYLGIAGLLLVAYFCLVAPFIKMETTIHASGNNVAVVQPGPFNAATKVAEVIAEAAKDKAIIAALEQQVIQLSYAQQTVANTVSQVSGMNSAMAAALAEGLTRGAPKQQVITVKTGETGKTSAVIAKSDDQIKKDLKEVLNDPNTQVHVKTDVTVSWQDKPLSPIFAVYTPQGSGVGYTLRRTKYLNLDALLLTYHKDIEPGLGVDHIFRGTSAGVGVGAVFDVNTRQLKPTAYVGIFF